MLATPTIQSGWAFEHAGQPHGSFCLIACSPAPRRGLTRFVQSPGLPFATPELWTQAEQIRSSAFPGPFFGTAAIVNGSSAGLDLVVAQTDGALAHFSYDCVAGWSGAQFLPGQAAGPPAFIQSRFGRGNLEVIVPCPGGGLSHFWRDSSAQGVWQEAANQPAHDGTWSGLGLIHSTFGSLVVAGVKDESLHFLRQNREGGTWSAKRVLMDTRSVGRPALIQSTYGVQGNFEVVVAKSDGGLRHYWRNNDDPWNDGPPFLSGLHQSLYRFHDVTMFQSSYDRLEVFAVEKYAKGKTVYKLIHYRSGLGQSWEGPIDVVDIPYDVTWWP